MNKKSKLYVWIDEHGFVKYFSKTKKVAKITCPRQPILVTDFVMNLFMGIM